MCFRLIVLITLYCTNLRKVSTKLNIVQSVMNKLLFKHLLLKP